MNVNDEKDVGRPVAQNKKRTVFQNVQLGDKGIVQAERGELVRTGCQVRSLANEPLIPDKI